MYVVVEHSVSNPPAFWTGAQQALPNMPAGITLHHTFPSPDGSKAICVWEAASVEAVRTFLEPVVGAMSRNIYYEVPNREGIAVPAAFQMA
jgi:hypothetical protein